MYLNLYISPLILGIGGGEMVLIIGVILMLFGSDKIPEMARGLARVINQVKSASNELKSEITKSVDETGVINDIKEAVNVEDIKKRIGIDDIKKSVNLDIDQYNPLNDVQQEIDKAKEDIETMTGPIKRQR
ncbi:sec-independent protein translocase protein TatA [Paenimyroides ummariense]|uniref:Sec-independent protein translocase protein TatA n=1 Tax=Paenimyroides ummariense TaxID=913024 RepID=A0A1I5E9N0_9FLAO|nr:twin-arginine translocase TatA/TatE family subunit [Paenimyroides ummariense]SFO08249.1 sec-independent protein translocase protein TatA [Paenimyroides ummariense]